MHSANKLTAATTVVCLAVATACVDHDYDLADDVDMTVQVGGDMTLPASDTELLSLSQILDLEEGSSIKEIGAQTNDQTYGLANGDYVLLQDGNSEPALFSVDQVHINTMNNSAYTELPPFVGTGQSEVTVQTNPTLNIVDLNSNDVPTELRRLDAATMDINIDFNISFSSDNFSGTVTIKAGYVADFDSGWTLAIEDAASADFLEMAGSHSVRFKKDYHVTPSNSMHAIIKLKAIDFSTYPDQGLVAPGVFKFSSDVHSHGNIAIGSSQLPAGSRADLVMHTAVSVGSNARIISATGLVDPEINISDTPFQINDIPEFLSDDANNLHVDNPRILFVVDNDSPLTLRVRGLLEAYKGGVSTLAHPVEIGYDNIITVPPTATTTYIICSHDEPGNPWFADKNIIVVPDLGDVLRTIPDEIRFQAVDCYAVQSPVTFALGHDYTFNAKYDAVIPLAFGSDMLLHYTHEDAGWDDDDIKDYNFNEATITANLVNTLPLTMTPAVEGLDRNLNTLSNITATITGADGGEVRVAPGTPGAPTVTPVNIVLRSTASNLGELDGIRIIFDAYDPIVGTNLNSAQSLRFENITIRLKGGITIDLND